ncbi:S39A6 protein, partial [Furnarius figulus]|nr:S39A6 protein [Furnarius figulus]
PHGNPHGHSHGPTLPLSPRATDIVWMVVLGDGIHNLTDGLAIAIQADGVVPVLGVGAGAAIGEGPARRRLGRDAAVLEEVEAERADGVLRWERLHGGEDKCQAVGNVLVGSACQGWGGAQGVAACADPSTLCQLPEALRGAEGPGEGTWRRFLLQNTGFLLGSGIMLGIALAEGHLRAWLQ